MAIDRSKFKASNQTEVETSDAASAQAAGKGNKSRADNVEIKIGVNRYRVYPAHPDDGGISYAEAVSKVFLPAMVPEREEGSGKPILLANGQPKLKKSMKPVFNSKVHGGTKKDLVEEYHRIGAVIAENIKDPEAKKKYLAKLNGQYHDKPEFRLPGLVYKLTYEMYVDVLGAGAQVIEFGRLAVSKGVKDKINVTGSYESSTDPLGLDPFSDPDRGLPLVVTKKTKNPDGTSVKANDMYSTTIDKSYDRQTEKLIKYPLSDEQLEKLETHPSLVKLFRNSFKKSDFELQLAGLEMFDADYQMGIFVTDEFLNIAEEIAGYYGDEPVEDPEQTDPEQGDVDPEEQDEPAGDFLTTMSRLELKNYITKEKLGITFKQNTKDEEIRDLIRAILSAKANGGIGADLPPVTPQPEVKPAAPVVAKTPPPTTGGGISAADRLKALKKGSAATA